MNDFFRQQISHEYREAELLKLARTGGMRTLLEDGVEKVRQGVTSLTELLRVLGSQTNYTSACGGCGELMEISQLYCPLCGTLRKNTCTNCLAALDEGWRECPVCGTLRNANLKL